MYLYTSLYKITAQGNWITDNPLYYVMNYPPAGVTKTFLLKDFLMTKPQLCYGIGLFVVFMEFMMLFLLAWRKTRLSAIYWGCFFQFTLLLCLDVPAILFFLFTSLLILWIDPHEILSWIEQKRTYNRKAGQIPLIFDGQCTFCRKSLRMVKIMDLFDVIRPVDFRLCLDLSAYHQSLTPEKAAQQVFLIEPDGRVFGGFFAFRRLTLSMPMAYPLIPVFYFPGMGIIGPLAYKLVARSRRFFNFFLPKSLLK